MFKSLGELRRLAAVTTHCQKPVRNHETKHGKELAETFREYFYVDSLLKLVQDEQTAIKLMKDVTALFSEGEFRFTKFVRNRSNVLVSISEVEKGL